MSLGEGLRHLVRFGARHPGNRVQAARRHSRRLLSRPAVQRYEKRLSAPARFTQRDLMANDDCRPRGSLQAGEKGGKAVPQHRHLLAERRRAGRTVPAAPDGRDGETAARQQRHRATQLAAVHASTVFPDERGSEENQPRGSHRRRDHERARQEVPFYTAIVFVDH